VSVPWAGGTVVDVDGAATWVLDGEPVLGWRCGSSATIDGVSSVVHAHPVTAELDELRYGFAAGPLRLELRHSLDETWAIRLSVTNPTSRPVTVSGIALDLACAAGWIGWAVRAGAEASVAVLPAQRQRPILGFCLLQGELRGAGGALRLPDLVLPAAGQYVLRLRGESYPDARHFASAARHDVLPGWPWVSAGELVRIDHQDQAVASSSGIDSDQLAELEGAVELEGEAGQTSHIELVGPRGTTEVMVAFAPTLGQVVAGRVALGEQLWPTNRQGVRLTEPADGLVVQAFLAGGGSTGVSHEVWSEALDSLCARVEADSSLLAVALLARQAVLTGDRDQAEQSAAGFAALVGEPGAPVVAAQVLAAGLVTGAVHEVPATGAVLDDLPAFGARFGFGLRGERVGTPDPVADARCLALANMQLALEPPRPRGWACGFAELVQRHRRRLLTQTYGDPGAAETVAWLTLGE